MATNQKVGSSNLSGPTTFPHVFRIRIVERCHRLPLRGTHLRFNPTPWSTQQRNHEIDKQSRVVEYDQQGTFSDESGRQAARKIPEDWVRSGRTQAALS